MWSRLFSALPITQNPLWKLLTRMPLIWALLFQPALDAVSTTDTQLHSSAYRSGLKRESYPVARRGDQIDEYHAIQVADPYRWMEDLNSPELATWVGEQNKLSCNYLKNVPGREALRSRLVELCDLESYSIPFKRAGNYYYFYRHPLQEQYSLYTAKSLEDEPRLLLDASSLSDNATAAISQIDISPKGRYLAYGVRECGSDWVTLALLEIESGKKLDDKINWVKFSRAMWDREGKGFYYCRFDPPASGEEYQSLSSGSKLYYHRVGTDSLEDPLIYASSLEGNQFIEAEMSSDGRFLMIQVCGEGEEGGFFYLDLEAPSSSPVEFNEGRYFSYLWNNGLTFYVMTSYGASNGRVLIFDLSEFNDPSSPDGYRYEELIAESDALLTDVSCVGDKLVCSYLKDAKSEVRVYDQQGNLLRHIDLPGIGMASGFYGSNSSETFYSFSSFAQPSTVYRCDVDTGISKPWRVSNLNLNSEDYEVEQVFYKSLDGTLIPMFVAHKKGILLDGNNPTLLYSYGGFNTSLSPGFSSSIFAWMERGGVYALPNIRGGGEYGYEWHRAGMRESKQNVFDDFIAAANWLIENGYTRPSKLAIEGASNGGLLVGACMTQRPELFGAAIPRVGVMDMLRFHKFTMGWCWTHEYGCSDFAEQFNYLYAYSPLHNIVPGTCYPPTLVMTSDHDDRVVPSHSFKFAATLQQAQGGSSPILLRTQKSAGHGWDLPLSQSLEQYCDFHSFIAESLQFYPPEAPKPMAGLIMRSKPSTSQLEQLYEKSSPATQLEIRQRLGLEGGRVYRGEKVRIR